jgi:hypothetical protein
MPGPAPPYGSYGVLPNSVGAFGSTRRNRPSRNRPPEILDPSHIERHHARTDVRCLFCSEQHGSNRIVNRVIDSSKRSKPYQEVIPNPRRTQPCDGPWRRYEGALFDRSGFASRRRIPAAVPSGSNTSRIPAASTARRIAAKLLGCGVFSALSKAATVRSDTLACLANSSRDHASHPRAARHCSGLMTSRCEERSRQVSIVLDLGNVA